MRPTGPADLTGRHSLQDSAGAILRYLSARLPYLAFVSPSGLLWSLVVPQSYRVLVSGVPVGIVVSSDYYVARSLGRLILAEKGYPPGTPFELESLGW